MMVQVPAVLSPVQVHALRARIDGAVWTDGNATSGVQSGLAKKNRQLPERSEAAVQAGAEVLVALEGNALFFAAALPLRVFPPLFNRYGAGDGFGAHVDNAVRLGGDTKVRSDLSATLFLSDPEAYEGGELVIEDTYGTHAVKLAAGDLVLYPASSLHSIAPITRGERVASFFWIQSMIRDDARRALLLQTDVAVQTLARELGHDHAQVVALTGVYHNLLRMWAEV